MAAGGGPRNLSIYSFKRERKDRRRHDGEGFVSVGINENRTFERMT